MIAGIPSRIPKHYAMRVSIKCKESSLADFPLIWISPFFTPGSLVQTEFLMTVKAASSGRRGLNPVIGRAILGTREQDYQIMLK